MMKRTFVTTLLCLMVIIAFGQKKPNVLVIFGDDIGYWNISAYNQGMMGYKTPNIDKIANEGVLFTDAYAQQSCTAGRAAFITGQSPLRTGLTTIGMPGSKIGLQKEDPTIAELLKPMGYNTGQFGKNHLGDRDEFLPTNHGFDEFFGNLYHLNAEEEPEDPMYPQDPEFKAKYAPRGVIRAYSDGRVEDTGPLTMKRMETADREFLDAAKDFMKRSADNKEPFFCWYNSTRMHVFTHLQEKYKKYVNKYNLYGAGMIELDDYVGEMLTALEDLGIDDNTIVIFTSDNGGEKMTFPDGGQTPFRGEKGSTWEGGVRVPFMIRWPDGIKGGQVINDMISHEDWLPTILSAAGNDNVKEELLKGKKAGRMTYKIHLDGYNFLPLLQGKTDKGPRDTFFYVADNGNIQAMRWDDWKVHFIIQEGEGPDAWFSGHRFAVSWPRIYNLRNDPFETADHSGFYLKWYGQKMFLFVPAKEKLSQFVMSFKDYPARQMPETLDPAALQGVIKQFYEMSKKK